MPEIREVVWCLGLEWRYEIGCTNLRSRLVSWAAPESTHAVQGTKIA